MEIYLKKIRPLANIMFKNLIMLCLIILFMSTYVSIFGQENSLTGVGIVTAFIFFLGADLGVKRKSGAFLLFTLLLSTVCIPYLAGINPYLGFILNFFGIFLIMLFTSQRMEYKIYIVFMLMYVFNEGNPVYGKAFMLRLFSMLTFGILMMLIYWFKHREDSKYQQLKDIPKTINVDQLSFCIKLAFSLSIAMLVSHIFEIYKHMWFTVTMFSLCQMHEKETFTRMKHRTIYTLLGGLIYVFVFGFFVPEHLLVYFTLIINYVYSFIKRYDIKILFITVNTLLANQIFFNNNLESALSRIILVILGVLFTYGITKINFNDIGKKIKPTLNLRPNHS